MKNNLLWLGALLCLWGCSPPQAEVSTYFDLQKLVDHQAEVLNAEPCTLKKKTTINGAVSETEVTTQIDWKKELAFFLQGDFNGSLYKTKTDSSWSKEGNLVLEYTSLQPNKPGPERLTITLDPDGKPLTISGNVSEKTVLFQKETDFDLAFSNAVLSTYSFNCMQKMKGLDKNTFQAEVKIVR